MGQITPDEIRQARKKLGLTQAEFGEKIGVSATTVSRWEQGHRKPIRMALRLLVAAKALSEIEIKDEGASNG